eukprot:SAG11_NODE_1322_length_5207_cov_3.093187_7_plen_48_part_00
MWGQKSSIPYHCQEGLGFCVVPKAGEAGVVTVHADEAVSALSHSPFA